MNLIPFERRSFDNQIKEIKDLTKERAFYSENKLKLKSPEHAEKLVKVLQEAVTDRLFCFRADGKEVYVTPTRFTSNEIKDIVIAFREAIGQR